MYTIYIKYKMQRNRGDMWYLYIYRCTYLHFFVILFYIFILDFILLKL